MRTLSGFTPARPQKIFNFDSLLESLVSLGFCLGFSFQFCEDEKIEQVDFG